MILRNFEQLDIDVIVNVKISFQAIYECIKKKDPFGIIRCVFDATFSREREKRDCQRQKLYSPKCTSAKRTFVHTSNAKRFSETRVRDKRGISKCGTYDRRTSSIYSSELPRARCECNTLLLNAIVVQKQ